MTNREELRKLEEKWRKLAIASREEAGRIRRTVMVATDAEANCNIRAEVWDKNADELSALLAGEAPSPEPSRDMANCPHCGQMFTYIKGDKWPFPFVLGVVGRGFDTWRTKPHNAKWWKRITGTPIQNDLEVCIAEQVREELRASLVPPAQGEAPAQAPSEQLQDAAKDVLEVIYQLDAREELPSEFTGELIDRLKVAVRAGAEALTKAPAQRLSEEQVMAAEAEWMKNPRGVSRYRFVATWLNASLGAEREGEPPAITVSTGATPLNSPPSWFKAPNFVDGIWIDAAATPAAPRDESFIPPTEFQSDWPPVSEDEIVRYSARDLATALRKGVKAGIEHAANMAWREVDKRVRYIYGKLKVEPKMEDVWPHGEAVRDDIRALSPEAIAKEVERTALLGKGEQG